MPTNLTRLFPLELHDDLHWLGTTSLYSWTSYASVTSDDHVPRTAILFDWAKLAAKRGIEQHSRLISMLKTLYVSENILVLTYLLAGAEMIADGPKLFQPTTEQWESMEHVDLNIPPADFRSPFPSFVIQIPPNCRRRLAAEFGVPLERVTDQVLVYNRRKPGEPSLVLLTVPFGADEPEEHFLFSDHPDNPTIEATIARRVVGRERLVNVSDLPEAEQVDRRLSIVIGRAAMNLAMMMTHYGFRVDGPLDPHAYQKHRRKKHLNHFKHGDYLAVNMKQHIVVRAPQSPTNNPPGPGTGIELAPHWRRGHWCAYPGQGALRAMGEQVPLYFKRPCLVRRDRMVGDSSQTEVTYHG